jgi:hypothetical protein
VEQHNIDASICLLDGDRDHCCDVVDQKDPERAPLGQAGAQCTVGVVVLPRGFGLAQHKMDHCAILMDSEIGGVQCLVRAMLGRQYHG